MIFVLKYFKKKHKACQKQTLRSLKTNTIAELESLDSSLKDRLADSLNTEMDPLENTILIGELLDRYLIAKNNSNILKQQPIKFNKELIEEPTTSQGSFWRGLLKR